MALIASEDEHYFRSGTLPQGFYFKGDKIVVVPIPLDTTYSLQYWYELPPGKLIPTSSAGLVQSISATTVTVANAPTTIAVNSLVDFIAGTSGCATVGMDVMVTNIAGNTYSFAAGTIPTSLNVGDYICPAQQSCLIQLPDEAYPLLETSLAIRILKEIGDFDGAGRLKEDEDDNAKMLKMIIEPRITGEPTKLINRRSLLRGYRGCLLYTSPSPRDRQKSRMPSSA